MLDGPVSVAKPAVRAQQPFGAVVDGRAGGEYRGSDCRVVHVSARVLVAAHEMAARETRAEQQTFAIPAVFALGVQLPVPVRPDGQETARGRDGRDQRAETGRQRDGGPVDDFHRAIPSTILSDAVII